jgi:hypothetical protein
MSKISEFSQKSQGILGVTYFLFKKIMKNYSIKKNELVKNWHYVLASLLHNT